MEKYPHAVIVTKEIADDWGTKRPQESGAFLCRRIDALRQLCKYMASLDIETYIPRNHPSSGKPVLTIPSSEDMIEFFEILDNRKTDARTYRYIYAHRIMFRLYYCCGLRLSEARTLRREDVDLENLTLTIKESKGHKDRLVYLPDDSKEIMSEYIGYISELFPLSPYVFPGQDPEKPVTGIAVDKMFRLCWAETNASRKYSKPPTVHCLRHAFVVERINQWAKEGVDLNVMLPYLSSYLGHRSIYETFYYYHMVDSAFSIIAEKGSSTTDVIPEVTAYEE